MTSNIGADMLKNSAGLGFSKSSEVMSRDKVKTMLMREVERFFRPEFLNRLDDVIIFNQLSKDDLRRIIDVEMAKVGQRLKDKKITLELSPEAIEFLIEKGFNQDFGARPLRRAIERYVEDPLSEELLRTGGTNEMQAMRAIMKEGAIAFEKVGGKEEALAAAAAPTGGPTEAPPEPPKAG
jgi:ATP-dependent Clp protease ATP-binding subunit ClpC